MSVIPTGSFSLHTANRYFAGWPTLSDDPLALVMAFPVEGWRNSAAVVVRQEPHGAVTGDVFGASGVDAEAAWRTAQATLSLDVNGAGFAEAGRRDSVIGGLQEHFGMPRPVCFHTPYEAACALIIGHRLSIVQTRAIRARLAEEHGDTIEVEDRTFFAFPRPHTLLEIDAFGPLAGEKMNRLHGIARAAIDGRLDRERLRSMPYADALSELRTLRGVGEFMAQGIMIRGAGLSDELSDDEVTRQAVQHAYNMPQAPPRPDILQLAEAWRPYRAWATVLLHMWLRREGGPKFVRPGRRQPATTAQ